jgi:hypothetical protein
MRRLAIVLVAIHAAVLLGHDAAHRDLGVYLNTWQTIFAYLIIIAAPVVAALLVFTTYPRLGFALLAISMLSALIFGVYHHYILVSPDHVSHLPAGDSQGLFRATAAVMGVLELAGVGLGVWGWRSHSDHSRAT